MPLKRKMTVLNSPPQPPPPTPPPKEHCLIGFKSKTRKSLSSTLDGWRSLPISRSELSLPLTLPTGQSFRWRQTSTSVFTGVIGPHLLSLRRLDDFHVEYLAHNWSDLNPEPVEAAISDYFNLEIGLEEMWRGFSDVDERFAAVAKGLGGGGARVMRQDPVECLFEFLCSSNNNIGRIQKMVGVLSSFGRILGSVAGFQFHEFPPLERLGTVTEEELRQAGFGYRAKYIIGTVKALHTKPGGGAKWLASLRGLELNDVIDSLCTLPGVGPKVAACIALFSLDKHNAIPVDTHVWKAYYYFHLIFSFEPPAFFFGIYGYLYFGPWKLLYRSIATRYLLPELAGKSLTSKLHGQVSDAFVSKFGKYAGWAQNVLFIAELPSQKATVDGVKGTNSAKRKHVKTKVAKVAVEVLVENKGD